VDLSYPDPRRGFARSAVAAVRGLSARGAVWAATATSAVVWTAVATVRQSLFYGGRYNLGNFTQAVWSTAHGHLLQMTEVSGTEVSRLGIHVDPIIALFAPLWWLWPSPKLLLMAQAVALSLGAIPLFLLARKHLGREWEAAMIAFAYLLCPTLEWNAANSFTAVAFAVPLLLLAIWYLDEERFVPFAAAAGAAILCQEQIGLLVGCLGLWYAWRQRRLRIGLVIAAAGFAASAVDVLVVLRHFSGGSPYSARLGGSPGGILRELFTHPLTLAHQINAHDLLGLLPAVPVLGLCFGSTILLAASPQIVLLLLSRRSADWSWFSGNMLLLLPFIYSATVYTLARLRRRSADKEPRFVAGQVLMASLAIALVLGPLGFLGGRVVVLGAIDTYRSPAFDVERRAVGLVPAGARVSATNHIALPLSARRYIYVFPVVSKADWVVVDSRDDWLPDIRYIEHHSGINFSVNDLYQQPALMRRELNRLEHSPHWQVMLERDHIYVFRRRKG
jgi:uncharacterized membrane protein